MLTPAANPAGVAAKDRQVVKASADPTVSPKKYHLIGLLVVRVANGRSSAKNRLKSAGRLHGVQSQHKEVAAGTPTRRW